MANHQQILSNLNKLSFKVLVALLPGGQGVLLKHFLETIDSSKYKNNFSVGNQCDQNIKRKLNQMKFRTKFKLSKYYRR